nr:polysaccharide deacetylase family protein [Paenibacillus sacheonensis]
MGKTLRTTATIILVLTVIAGCASAKNETKPDHAVPESSLGTENKGNNDRSAADASVEETVPKAGSNQPAAAKPEKPASAGSGTVGSKPANTPVPAAPPKKNDKKLYRMNSVYSFVPINKETTSGKVVLLTFDDGPKADKTVTALLDILDKHKAKAIFFVNGYRVKQHPELLEKIAARGQTIGNHSWDHIDLKKETEETVKKQVGDVQEIVKRVTGSSPVFFRPPFGSGNDKVKSFVRSRGMLYMTWSNGSLDWDGSTKNKPDKVIANVLDQLHPGVNILMHELPWTIEALDSLLTKLEAKGYGFIDPAAIDINSGSNAPTAK